MPILKLGKRNYRPKVDYEAKAGRDKRAKKREQLALERQEREAAEKCWKLHESSLPVAQIDFSQPGTSTEEEESRNERDEESFSIDPAAIEVREGEEIEPETVNLLKEAECQTTEFDYMFQKSKYQAPNKRDFFDSDDKVRFYTGLPSMEVLMVVFGHVAPHVTRQTQPLDGFQEFIIVLMKLRLNAPLQDLAHRFVVCVNNFKNVFPLDCFDGH